MKSFYSCTDNGLIVPQPIQHVIIRNAAQKAGGAVTFYGAEDPLVLEFQPFIRVKLKRTPGLDGVVFFTLQQFMYGESFDYKLLREILASGLEVHFAREGISLLNEKDLDDAFAFIASIDFTKRRDAGEGWKRLLRSLDTEI